MTESETKLVSHDVPNWFCQCPVEKHCYVVSNVNAMKDVYILNHMTACTLLHHAKRSSLIINNNAPDVSLTSEVLLERFAQNDSKKSSVRVICSGSNGDRLYIY